MARFQCAGCHRRHSNPLGCPRCDSTGGQIPRCRTHGARHRPGCRTCRPLTRSYSGL